MKSLQARIGSLAGLGSGSYARLLERVLEIVSGWAGGIEVPIGFRHGDMTPWNMLTLGQKLFIFDWEYATSASPAAWDLFHFLLHRAVHVRGGSARRAYDSVVGHCATQQQVRIYFRAVGVPLEFIEPLFILYLVDVLTWYLSPMGQRQDPKLAVLTESCKSFLSWLLLRENGGDRATQS